MWIVSGTADEPAKRKLPRHDEGRLLTPELRTLVLVELVARLPTRVLAFFAVRLPAVFFFAATFLAAGFFPTAFFRVAFFLVAFVPATFFAATLLAVDFFFPADFFTVDFLGAIFFAADFFLVGARLAVFFFARAIDVAPPLVRPRAGLFALRTADEIFLVDLRFATTAIGAPMFAE